MTTAAPAPATRPKPDARGATAAAEDRRDRDHRRQRAADRPRLARPDRSKAQEAADQWDDVEFRLVEAADADSQASQIQTLINEEPDALVVLPYDGEQLTPVAEQAMEAASR